MYAVAKDEFTATDLDIYHALAYAVRDRLMERWFLTQDTYYRSDAKRVYYLSMEFLPGRVLLNNILNLGAHAPYARAIEKLGYDLADIAEREVDAGLGERRPRTPRRLLRRLGLDARPPVLRLRHPLRVRHLPPADQGRPAGRGARQLAPLREPVGDPAPRLPHPGDSSTAGRSRSGTRRATSGPTGSTPRTSTRWRTTCRSSGYRNDTVNSLRLWSARSTREFDLATFNAGRLRPRRRGQDEDARTSRRSSTRRTTSSAGKELRLKQQYFFVSATLQDVDPAVQEAGPPAPGTSFPTRSPSSSTTRTRRSRSRASCACSSTRRGSTGSRVGDHAGGLRLHEPHGSARRRSRPGRSRLFGQAPAPAPPDHRGDRPPLPRARPPPASPATRRGSSGRPSSTARTAALVRMAHLAIVGSHAVNGVAKLHTEILKARRRSATSTSSSRAASRTRRTASRRAAGS